MGAKANKNNLQIIILSVTLEMTNLFQSYSKEAAVLQILAIKLVVLLPLYFTAGIRF